MSNTTQSLTEIAKTISQLQHQIRDMRFRAVNMTLSNIKLHDKSLRVQTLEKQLDKYREMPIQPLYLIDEILEELTVELGLE